MWVSTANSALSTVLLLLGEEICAGAQEPPRPVERIVFAAPVPVEILLNTASALIQSIASKVNDVEGVHHHDRARESFGRSGLERLCLVCLHMCSSTPIAVTSSSRCSVTSRPSSSSRQNVVSSGQAKVTSGTLRYPRSTAPELDPYTGGMTRQPRLVLNCEEPVIFSMQMQQYWLYTVNPVRPDIPAKLWRYLRHTLRCIKPS